MEEYEVDLRDYLEVIWKRKWIIILVIIVAVGVATAYSYTQPNEYKTKGTYKVPELPQLDSAKLTLISKEEVLTILNSRDLARKVATSGEFNQAGWPKGTQVIDITNWIAAHFNAENPTEQLLDLKIRGAKEPQFLKDTLAKIVAVFQEELVKRTASQIEEEKGWLEEKREALMRDRTELKEKISQEIKKMKSEYQTRISYLQTEINGIESNKKYRDLKVGESNATLMGFMLRERYHTLNERLNFLAKDLDLLELSPRQFFPDLYQNLDSTEDKIERVKGNIETLERLQSYFLEGEKTLVTFDSPYVPWRTAGPNRRMNIAVAGVLGVFLGTLLAFFVEYMSKPREENK